MQWCILLLYLECELSPPLILNTAVFWIFLIVYMEIVLSFFISSSVRRKVGRFFFVLEIKHLKKKGLSKKNPYIFPSWTLMYLKTAQAFFLLQSPDPVLQHGEAPLILHKAFIRICNGICFLLSHQIQKLVKLRKPKEWGLDSSHENAWEHSLWQLPSVPGSTQTTFPRYCTPEIRRCHVNLCKPPHHIVYGSA